MSTLHIVSSSVFRTEALQRAIQLARSGDAILLIEDGVYGATDAPATKTLLSALQSDVALHVLAEDLAARALPARLAEFVEVSYAGFVDLVCQHTNSVNWS